MAKQVERVRAATLRKRGRSISEIAKVLGVSKSTVSGWCREIRLTNIQIHRIASRSAHRSVNGLLRAAEAKRTAREIDIQNMTKMGAADVKALSRRDRFMVGLGLYWGEGYKRGSQELGFTNSDPDIIRFFIAWLKEIYGISKDQLILRISINQTHRGRIKEVETFWSDTTGVPLSQFTKPSFIRAQSKKAYANKENHFGTLRVKVRRGTSLRRRILGAISALKY